MLEPFGPPAAFWQAGMVASIIANVNRTSKSQKAYTPDEFMPTVMTEVQEPDEQVMTDTIIETFKSLGRLSKQEPHGQ